MKGKWKVILLVISIFFFFLFAVSLLMTASAEGSITGYPFERNILLSMALLFMVLYIAARFRRRE
ncbi:hypothetical protein [Jeotgalibacillus sp. R-1-5s-1]|uniref:hypothetical protein n=1 Tax=Jeotgalibacillus sp. R-1-5s-1 TaxID=2555897 RepID=UPI0010697099|nr:hypothetical protein [Jeotgalibacillus sp. R-1-5s-1]TFD99664.1 hypothetical protein E2491_07140 [Jeotgalibacillus sp. R-1-5s-1]